MKVYVENGDIPKRCIECRFCYYSEDEYCHCCRINGIDIENKKCWRETHPDCPLLSLADYTKQVRKEVCEEISWKLNRRLNGVINGKYSDEFFNGYSYCSSDIENILDQTQGEKK